MLNMKPKSHNRDSAYTQPKPFFARTLRKFFRKRTAAALVEFAVIAIPFFTLIMGIIEAGLIFWAGYELENATAAAARLVRTGQAQTSGYTIAVAALPERRHPLELRHEGATQRTNVFDIRRDHVAKRGRPERRASNKLQLFPGRSRGHRVPCRLLRVAADNPSYQRESRESWGWQLPSSEQFRIS
jgi:hypothetical protein